MYGIVPNDETQIKNWLIESIENEDVQIIITSGGTGIGSVDKTVDTLIFCITLTTKLLKGPPS